MNLNLSGGGGNGNYIRFSPQANAWSNQDGEFQLGKFVFDIENIQTGWMLIATGIFEFAPDDSLGRKGAQPSPEHKRGFKVTFYNKEIGVAEWSANGAGSNMGLEALYKLAAQGLSANAGKLPVVEYKGSRPEKVGKGSTRVPIFEISGWVARPAALAEGGEPEYVQVPTTQVPAPVSKPAPTPVAKPAPSPAMSDDEMFS
jgi:hypothetical protein